jgi:hypothetical protein
MLLWLLSLNYLLLRLNMNSLLRLNNLLLLLLSLNPLLLVWWRGKYGFLVNTQLNLFNFDLFVRGRGLIKLFSLTHLHDILYVLHIYLFLLIDFDHVQLIQMLLLEFLRTNTTHYLLI